MTMLLEFGWLRNSLNVIRVIVMVFHDVLKWLLEEKSCDIVAEEQEKSMEELRTNYFLLSSVAQLFEEEDNDEDDDES